MDFDETEKFFQARRELSTEKHNPNWRDRFDVNREKLGDSQLRALEAVYRSCMTLVAAGEYHRIFSPETEIGLEGGLPSTGLFDCCVTILEESGWREAPSNLEVTRSNRARLRALSKKPRHGWTTSLEEFDRMAAMYSDILEKLESNGAQFNFRQILSFENPGLPQSTASLVLAKTEYGGGDQIKLSVAIPQGGDLLLDRMRKSQFLFTSLTSSFDRSSGAFTAHAGRSPEDNTTEIWSVMVHTLDDLQLNTPFWPPPTSLYLEATITAHRAH
jgi:hypothetical protein